MLNVAIEVLFASLVLLYLMNTDIIPFTLKLVVYCFNFFPTYHYSKAFNELQNTVLYHFSPTKKIWIEPVGFSFDLYFQR